jgi:hypothetical protein
MAFLCTFSGMLIAGVVWMGLFLGLHDSSSRELQTLVDWISPENATGWVVYGALCIAFCLLMFRLLGSRLADHSGP